MPQEQKSRKSGKKSSAENQEKSGPDFVFFLLLLFFPPLIFFTEITRNPYIIQNLVFQTGIGILLLWKLIRSRGIISLPKTPADRPLALWGGYILLSIFCSLVLYPEHRDAFFSFWRGRIIFFLFNALAVYYLSAHYSRSSRQLDRIFYTVIFASTLSSFYALMQYSGNEFIWPQNLHHYGSRAVSTFGNPNFLSSYLLVVNMILLYLFFRRKGGTSVLFLLFFNLFALLITQTRSSWFGFLVSAILFIILAAPGLRGLSRKISLLAGLAILTVLVFPRLAYLKDHPQVWDRILDARRFDSAATAQAVRQRLMIWEAAWKIFKDSPLLGHGWGSFELLYPYKQGELLLKRKIYTPYRTHANNTHNEIMEVLSQTGAAGLLLYAFLWYVFFSSLFRARRSDGSGLILLSLSVAAGYFTDNLLNVTLHFPMPAILFWMLCGIGMGRCTEDKYNIDLKKYFPFLMTVGSAAALFFFIFQVHLWLGEVYYFTGFKTSRLPGRLEESVKWCRRSWEMYPYNVDNNYEMGNSYARL
ncbi:MAG TPA: O-antigen ligase family protein, partial [bacterium]|nr:O-antigen ligase family protein [bacterium]